MSTTAAFSPFQLTQSGKQFSVHSKRSQEAAEIDKNKDNNLSDKEILDYMEKNDHIGCAHHNHGPDGHDHAGVEGHAPLIDEKRAISEFKDHLQGKMPESMLAYRSYEQMGAKLDELTEQYPGLAKKVSLGKTHEGRDIWALKISKNVNSEETKSKPAVVVTGAHHAREWATTMLPVSIAEDTLANYESDPAAKNRVDNGELWFVPMVNPDGYEFSRTENSYWRKNRRPITETPCGPVRGDVRGVDLNRNYADNNPDHAAIWRPEHDDQCSFRDDGRATSDNPRRDTYRGPSGASEVEVQSLLKLELDRGNVEGVLDFHSYGGMILFPWGHTSKNVDNVEAYKEVGGKMNDALGDKRYRVFQSSGLYPTTGGSHDIHHVNDIFSITMEIGNSFHPRESELGPIVARNTRAGTVFIDEVLARSPKAASQEASA